MPGIRPTAEERSARSSTSSRSRGKSLRFLPVKCCSAAALLCSVTPAQLLLLFLTKVSLLPGLDWRRRRLSSEAEKSTFRKLWAYPACCCIAFWRVLIHIPAFDPHTCFRFSYCNFLFSSQVSILQVFIFCLLFVDFAYLGFSVTRAHNPQNDSCVMKGLRPLRSYAILGSNQVKRVKLIMLAFSFIWNCVSNLYCNSKAVFWRLQRQGRPFVAWIHKRKKLLIPWRFWSHGIKKDNKFDHFLVKNDQVERGKFRS